MCTTPEMIETNQSGGDAFLDWRQSSTWCLEFDPSRSAIIETEAEIRRTGQDAHGFEADRGMGIAISAVGAGHPDDFWLETRSQELAELFLQFLFGMFHYFTFFKIRLSSRVWPMQLGG